MTKFVDVIQDVKMNVTEILPLPVLLMMIGASLKKTTTLECYAGPRPLEL